MTKLTKSKNAMQLRLTAEEIRCHIQCLDIIHGEIDAVIASSDEVHYEQSNAIDLIDEANDILKRAYIKLMNIARSEEDNEYL